MAMSALGKTFLLCFICVLAKTVSARIGSLVDPAPSPTLTPYDYYATDPPASGSSGYGSSYGSSGSSGCFSGSETVTLDSGDVKFISDVVVGDRVLAADSDGQTIFSDVVFVPHGSNKQSAIFTQISTEDGRDVKMTHNHILPAGVCGNVLSLVYASKVTVGDCIQTASGQERVSKIDFVRGEGLYTIVTKEEYIVVNGIIASSFAVNHMMANLYYNMHRIIYSLSPVLLASKMVHSLNEGMGMFIPLFGSV